MKKSPILTSISIISGLLIFFPIFWLIMSSFKPESELFSYPLTLFPKDFTVENYSRILENGFLQYISNSFFLAIVATLIVVAVSATCGYAVIIYKDKVKYVNIIFGILLLGALVPGEILVVSQFSVISSLGFYNNIWGVIFPVITNSTGIFMFRQFFSTVPMSFVEAGRIDGASEGYIFGRIMLPLAKPTTITLIIFSFMWRWNDYILPLLVLSDQEKYTIQVAIKSYIGANTIDWSSVISASVLSIIPVAVLYLFLQKYIVNNNISAGNKG